MFVASISIAVISSIVISPFARVFFRISSLDVPEEYAIVFPFKPSIVSVPFSLLPITASPLDTCASAKISALPLMQSL